MDQKELLKRVRRIEIKTRVLSNNIFAGEYHSAYKGKGMSFSEVREYQPGDDVRDIDWNVTSRFNKPYIKVYEEERELTVMLLVDVSSSLAFGTSICYKRDMVTEIAATLAYSAILNNDKIGVVLFSDQVECYIPPKKGKKHILYIISQLLNFIPERRGTDIGNAMEFLMHTQHKSCTSFLISDLVDIHDYSNVLSVMARKHDMSVIQVYDRFSMELPDVGLLKIQDAENGEEHYINTSNPRIRTIYENLWRCRQKQLSERMKKSNIDMISIRTDENFVRPLINLFAKRS